MSTTVQRIKATRLSVAISIVAIAAVTAACASHASGGGSATETKGNAATGAVGAPETKDLTVAFGTNSAATTPLWLAAEEGLFAKNGLNVKVIEATSTVGATAVVAGSAQFFLGESTSTFQAVAAGRPVSIVATLQKFNNQKFVVRPEITDPSQLKGKPIAISANGDSTDLSVRVALAHFGLSASDVTLVPSGASSSRIASLLSKRVSATVLSEPSAGKAIKAGMTLSFDMTTQEFPTGAITVSKGFAQKNPNTVELFLQSLIQGIAFFADPANEQECLKVIAKYIKEKPTDDDVISGYKQYGGAANVLAKDPTPEASGATTVITGLKSFDAKLYKDLTPAQVEDTSFMNKLKSDGFLDKTFGSALNAAPSASPSS